MSSPHLITNSSIVYVLMFVIKLIITCCPCFLSYILTYIGNMFVPHPAIYICQNFVTEIDVIFSERLINMWKTKVRKYFWICPFICMHQRSAVGCGPTSIQVSKPTNKWTWVKHNLLGGGNEGMNFESQLSTNKTPKYSGINEEVRRSIPKGLKTRRCDRELSTRSTLCWDPSWQNECCFK